jgi:hypothetical protein
MLPDARNAANVVAKCYTSPKTISAHFAANTFANRRISAGGRSTSYRLRPFGT